MSWINTNKTNNQDSHTIEGLSEGQYNIRLKVTNSIGNVISNEINVSVEIVEMNDLYYYGLWDFYAGSSNTVPNENLWQVDGEWHMNIGKSMAKNISQIVGEGLEAIPHGDVFVGSTQSEIESRIRDVIDWAEATSDITNNTPIIHFMDEPEQKDVTEQQMLDAINYAKSYETHNFKYAYTINTTELDRLTGSGKVTGYGDYDYVFIQVYPYRKEFGDIANTKNALFSELDTRLSHLKDIAPDAKYFIVGQGFYSLESAGGNDKWRMPPNDAPFWYAEWVAQNVSENVEGLIYWRRAGGSNYVGMDHSDFDQFRDNMNQAYIDFVK